MDNEIFNKYIETINFFNRNNKNKEILLLDLHFPWGVKILSARYQPSVLSGRLIFLNKGIEIEAYPAYPYLPFAIIFSNERQNNEAEFWYKLEANENIQIIRIDMDKDFAPGYLLSRKAEIIREALAGQLNLEKFSVEFNKSVFTRFV